MNRETAADRKRRKRIESRHRAQGLLRDTRAMQEATRYGIRPHLPIPPDNHKLAKAVAAHGMVTEDQARGLLDELATKPNDGQCHAQTRKGPRCKNKTDGRWCARHRKDH